MTALTMASLPRPLPDNRVRCVHCGKILGLSLEGRLVIECRRCGKTLTIVAPAKKVLTK